MARYSKSYPPNLFRSVTALPLTREVYKWGMHSFVAQVVTSWTSDRQLVSMQVGNQRSTIMTEGFSEFSSLSPSECWDDPLRKSLVDTLPCILHYPDFSQRRHVAIIRFKFKCQNEEIKSRDEKWCNSYNMRMNICKVIAPKCYTERGKREWKLVRLDEDCTCTV